MSEVLGSDSSTGGLEHGPDQFVLGALCTCNEGPGLANLARILCLRRPVCKPRPMPAQGALHAQDAEVMQIQLPGQRYLLKGDTHMKGPIVHFHLPTTVVFPFTDH